MSFRILAPGIPLAFPGSVPRLAMSAVFILALAGCGEGGGGLCPEPVTSPDAGPPAGQGSAPRGDVVINEVAADGPDWIELLNRGSSPADIGGWFVSDAPDRLDHYYRFPDGTTLAPGAYLVVACDEVQAPFKLGKADGAYLIRPDGSTADAVLYLAPADGTLARTPDGEGLFFAAAATPGGANP